jgi:energy-coupling factor transporter ATP-binding protein EcfA2
MTSIDDIIKREVNPFDLINLKPGNFWGEKQDSALTVESIHQEASAEIEALLDLVATDHRSRTALLLGDSGSGKSYLLGRLKRTLNPKAFFAYIGPWADSDHIWRHTLRYTVDSLMQVPEGQHEGQQESQLMLWLKSLSAFTKRNLKQRIFNDNFWDVLQSDRQKFIKHLKSTYKKEGIYSSDIFFGILHDLTDPELYPLACEWLRGDDLSEESMQALKVKHCIDTEDAAKNLLTNLGKISTETQPIVLCFDNLDNIPHLSDGFQDFQPLFNVNTTIHNDYLKNFLVVISIITNTWKRNVNRIQQADKARLDRVVQLKSITLEEAEALWAYRLKPLHNQVNSHLPSNVHPLHRQALEQKYPGGRTLPRYALVLGREEYQKYKNQLGVTIPVIDKTEKIKAEFQLQWQDEYKKIQGKITKITLLSAPELIRILEEALSALQAQEIKPKLIGGKFASYSLTYQQPGKRGRLGVVWTEDASMTSFYSVMNACQKALSSNLCKTLYLIRAAGVGNSKLEGNKIYRQIFTGSQHHHIQPNLSSVHDLATYHSLVNSALANELVVAGKTLSLEELQDLIRQSEILNKCTLLQDLGIVSRKQSGGDKDNDEDNLQEIEEFLLNLVKTQSYLARKVLIQNTVSQFSQISQSKVDNLIQQLCQDNKIQIINPNVQPEAQLICFVPQN